MSHASGSFPRATRTKDSFTRSGAAASGNYALGKRNERVNESQGWLVLGMVTATPERCTPKVVWGRTTSAKRRRTLRRTGCGLSSGQIVMSTRDSPVTNNHLFRMISSHLRLTEISAPQSSRIAAYSTKR